MDRVDAGLRAKERKQAEDDINGLEAAILHIRTPEARERAVRVIAIARLGLAARFSN